MELVGKVVRKEIDGVGFFSGTVQSYDHPSGCHKIVYENGVTETSKLAEFAALVVGEGKSEETPDHGKSNRKRPRAEIKQYKMKLQDEVNVMRNVDLNDAVPEDSEGFGGNFDLNSDPVETLALDLNKAVPEFDEGLGYEEDSRNKRRRLIDLNMEASCDMEDDAEVCDLNADEREGWFDLNVAVNVENSNDDVLVQMNGDGGVQETNVQGENGVQDNLEAGGCEEVHVAEVSSGQILEELGEQNSVSPQDLNAADSNGAEGDFDLPELDTDKTVQKSLSDREILDENGVQDNLETRGCKEVHVAEVSSGQILEELRKQNNVPPQDLNADDSDGAERDHDLPELDADKTVDKSLSDREVPDENGVQDNLETRGCEGIHVTEVSSGQILEELREQNSVSSQDLNADDSDGAERDHDLPELDADKTVDKSLSDREVPDENGVQDNLETGGCKEVHVAEVSSGQILEELREQNSVSPQDLNAADSNRAEGDHDLPELDADKTVDKSLSDRETRFRRSSRRVLAPIPASSTVTACLADEVSPSPSVNSLTAEKNGIVGGEAENISVLPPKPQLPPSSATLNLDGLPVLYVFATYSFLRSFSTELFLSPFELKDFVEALRCTSPSLLFDSIHVSVLQILRKGLEKLAAEDDQSATICLRSLDWDMLDVVNYPLYLVEYLLFSGSKDNPGVDLAPYNFFRNEYFRLPKNQKIEILTRLCCDIIIEAELNKRSVAVESEMETHRTKVRRTKLAITELADDFSSDDGVVDGSFDENGDECCICKMDGNLLCCDGCPAAYHSKCVGVACDLLPEGVWYCPECSFDRRGAGWKPAKQIEGSELIEIDPHGRKYYSSCGYLVVIDTNGSGSVNYYHVNDVILVLEQLNSCGSFYIGVTSAIKKHWNIPVKAPLSAPEKQATSGVKKRLEETSSNGGSHLRCHRTRGKISGSATRPDVLNISSEGSAETAHNGLDVQSLHEPESSSILDVMKEPNTVNTRKEVGPNAQSESGYRNQYIFAQMTTAISEEMARNSPDSTNDMRFHEEIASAQVKTILMKTTKFQWRNIQGLYIDAWKEKCGWCHSCKSEDAGSQKNCLFNMSLGALRGPSESEIANNQPIDNKSHLMAIIWQLLSMESRLKGLLVGPWLNPQHSSIWREHILKASSISSLRHSLVEFVANLHHLVLSPHWLNHVDNAVEMGSSRHVIFASTGFSLKTPIGKRRGTSLKSGFNPTAKKNSGLFMSWWRGGRLSRKLFNWKVLPRSLVSKAAKQGGSVNIPGIMYPENSEPAKRSLRVAWEAAVESSRTSEQLGFQVRTLHSYIKWDDIENSHLLLALDKESKKSAGQFKKVIVRKKCIEEETVNYLLDFGKGRNIPDVVSKNGRMIERRQYWLNESYVPLHLLKGFEERKAVRKTRKRRSSFRHPKIDKVRKRSSEGKGFSYLFKRAERSKFCLCEHCKKNVRLSAAACCHICKRLFHKKHIRRADKEGMYICLPCKREVLAEEQPIVRKRGRSSGSSRKKVGAQTTQRRRKVVIPARRSTLLSVRLKKHKKAVASKPSRRSGRKTKQVIRLQDESQVRGGSKRQKLETKRGSDRPKKAARKNSITGKRSERCSSYWLNGLRLSRKPSDERIDKFWRDRCSKPLEKSGSVQVRRKCRLCGSNDSESESILIACETCEKWYHGDACGINDWSLGMVIGFRCHHCRELSPPPCPHM